MIQNQNKQTIRMAGKSKKEIELSQQPVSVGIYDRPTFPNKVSPI